jgi:hypothetical protein
MQLKPGFGDTIERSIRRWSAVLHWMEGKMPFPIGATDKPCWYA